MGQCTVAAIGETYGKEEPVASLEAFVAQNYTACVSSCRIGAVHRKDTRR